MQSCLGIYIQDNLIKYAKVSKDRNNLKIEAYGVKFYDTEVEEIIEQIVKETFSYQTPISVNIDKEKYAYSSVFGLLKQQDLEKSIDTEFEFFCNNNNQNKNTVEYRKIQSPDIDDRDKVRILYTYIDKSNLVERIQLLDKYKIQNVSPVPVIIPNLNKAIMQENSMIINMEADTELTTIVNGKVYKVDKIGKGMKDILEAIAVRENSTKRAYEICKNTTVYTKSSQNLNVDGNEYLDEIIAVLLDIIDKVKDAVAKNGVEINNIYITGMGLIINNIDLLFQENFIDKKCEILVPYFVEKTNIKINIKDYIEVNSAISLALQGLETKNQELNFNDRGTTWQKLMDILTSDVGKGIKLRTKSQKQKLTLKDVAHSELDYVEKLLMRTATTLLLIIMLYIGTTETMSKEIKKKISDAETSIENSKAKIAKVTEYNSMITARTTEYENIVSRIDEANNKLSSEYLSKNAIPNLLNKIMARIPIGVQLLSIENTSEKDITITAQAEKYDQLGYFKAALEEEGILTDITTTKGTKQNELIGITITGKLPY